MKKIALFLCMICLVGCSSSSDLSQYETESQGVLYYLDEAQPNKMMRIYLASGNSDTITKLKISTIYDKAFVKQYLKDENPETFFQNKELTQQKNERKDKTTISGYGSYDDISTRKEPLPFFSTVYESVIDESYNLEILMFNFCVADLDLSKKENKQLLKRYGLWDAYDSGTGYLSYKKLLNSKDFDYDYYFTAGVKESF